MSIFPNPKDMLLDWEDPLSVDKMLYKEHVYNQAMARMAGGLGTAQHSTQNQIQQHMGGLSHGNRQAAAQIYSNTSNGTSIPSSTARATANAILAYYCAKGYGAYPGRQLSYFSLDDLEPKLAIPTAGVKFGEVVGYRIWRVENNKLKAFYKDVVWEPGVPMSGLPGDHKDDGIWAFKEKNRAIKKMMETSGSVYGSVKLWGKVIEYEEGYRAEFASVTAVSGSCCLKNLDLDALDELYAKREVKPCE